MPGNQMSPEDMERARALMQSAQPEGAPMEGPQEGVGDVTALVADISDKLTQLAQVVAGGVEQGQTTEQDTAAISDVLSQFQGFVQNNLGAAAGTDAPVAPAPMGGGPVPEQVAGSGTAVPLP